MTVERRSGQTSVQGFPVLMDCTFYCVLQLASSAVFSLSLCVLRQCDLCGLPGLLPKASSASGLRRGLSEGFP